MKCTFHPNRDTYLSCGSCNRAVCIDCVRHTSVGSRCLECLGGRRPPGEKAPLLGLGDIGKKPAEKTRQQYLATFLGVIFLNMLAAPLFLLPALVLAVVIGAVRRLEAAGRLLGGAVFFVGCWAVVIPTVLPLTQTEDGRSRPLAEMHIGTGAGLFIFLASLLVVPLFWRPARLCAEQLVEQDRGLSAGLLLGSALSGTAISLMSALFFLLLSL